MSFVLIPQITTKQSKTFSSRVNAVIQSVSVATIEKTKKLSSFFCFLSINYLFIHSVILKRATKLIWAIQYKQHLRMKCEKLYLKHTVLYFSIHTFSEYSKHYHAVDVWSWTFFDFFWARFICIFFVGCFLLNSIKGHESLKKIVEITKTEQRPENFETKIAW